MGNTSSSHRVSSQDRAILDLKIQRDKLQQYQKRITVITSRETAIAKECLLKNDRKRALLALRRKKYQESLLAKTDQQLAQLQALTSDVEFALVQKDVLFGLQQGTAVLKEIHKEMGGLDKVEMILEESAEAQAYQQEISDMLAGKMSNEDEDEVEDELEALEREATGIANLPEAPSVTTKDELPEVPNGSLQEQTKQETADERAKRRRAERSATGYGPQLVAA